MARRILIYPDASRLFAAAARLVERAARDAIGRRGRFRLALTGGSTPRDLYARLAVEPCRSRIDWSRVEFFWGDDRCVPPDHPESNFRLADELLLSRLAPADSSVHRIQTELGAQRAAEAYAAELRRIFADDTPRFDLILLGMGPDGHTASLFPDTPDLTGEGRSVIATLAPRPPRDRISLSLQAINAARRVAFLVQGAGKAEALARVLADRPRADERALPAALVRPAGGRLYWLVDRAAASRLATGIS